MDKKKRWIRAICMALTLITALSGCGKWIKDLDKDKDEICYHVWDSGVVTIAATCSSEGEKKYTCKDCGETKTEMLAKNEEHSLKIIERKQPTCTESGSDYGLICRLCQEVLVTPQKIPALGHNYGIDGVCQNGGDKCPDIVNDDNWTANY